MALGIQRSVGKYRAPFGDVVRDRGSARDDHTRSAQPVLFVLFVHPFRRGEVAVVVGHGQNGFRSVLRRGDLCARGGAEKRGEGRIFGHGFQLLIPSDEFVDAVLRRRGVGGTCGDRVGGDVRFVRVFPDDEGHGIVPRRVDVDGGVDDRFPVRGVLFGRGDQFWLPVIESAYLVGLGEVCLVSRGRGRRLALVGRRADDPGRHIEADGVGRQPVFADDRRVGRIGVGGDEFFIPAGDLTVVLVGLPFKIPRVFRSLSRRYLDRRFGPVHRKSDGIDPVVGGRRFFGFSSAGGEEKQNGEQDHCKRKQMRTNAFQVGTTPFRLLSFKIIHYFKTNCKDVPKKDACPRASVF